MEAELLDEVGRTNRQAVTTKLIFAYCLWFGTSRLTGHEHTSSTFTIHKLVVPLRDFKLWNWKGIVKSTTRLLNTCCNRDETTSIHITVNLARNISCLNEAVSGVDEESGKAPPKKGVVKCYLNVFSFTASIDMLMFPSVDIEDRKAVQSVSYAHCCQTKYSASWGCSHANDIVGGSSWWSYWHLVC